jgi:hypothetical protein
MNQAETPKRIIMKSQFLFISIFLAMVFAASNIAAESTDEVTYTDASSSDIKEISNWVRKEFSGQIEIESLDVDAIIYTSPAMEEVFIPGSFYVHITVNGDKSPGMVMCRVDTGIEMVPDSRRVPNDLVTPLHINKRFRITSEEDAIYFHKALAHFYGRGDPNFSSNREATKLGDIWTLTDVLESSTEMGYKVKVDAEGKVLEISRYSIFPE